MTKLTIVDREIPASEKLNYFGEKADNPAVVSWGSPKGAILEARERLQSEGIEINFLQVRMLNPFPAAEFSALVNKSKKVIDVEMNYSGQLAGIVREKTGAVIGDFILKYNGRPMTSDEVYSALRDSIKGEAERRQVLTHGA
jgi:2-oxoglutarate ferredoxin oxidoreductase subunit alpha